MSAAEKIDKVNQPKEVVQEERVSAASQKPKDPVLALLLSFFFPIFGWMYSKGIAKGALTCLAVYIPLGFLVFIPIIGWAAIFIGHLTMTYLSYKSVKDQQV